MQTMASFFNADLSCQIFLCFQFLAICCHKKRITSSWNCVSPQNQFWSKLKFSIMRCIFIIWHMAILIFSIWWWIFICFHFLVNYHVISSSKSVSVKTDILLKVSFSRNWFPPHNQFQLKLICSSEDIFDHKGSFFAGKGSWKLPKKMKI